MFPLTSKKGMPGEGQIKAHRKHGKRSRGTMIPKSTD